MAVVDYRLVRWVISADAAQGFQWHRSPECLWDVVHENVLGSSLVMAELKDVAFVNDSWDRPLAPLVAPRRSRRNMPTFSVAQP